MVEDDNWNKDKHNIGIIKTLEGLPSLVYDKRNNGVQGSYHYELLEINP